MEQRIKLIKENVELHMLNTDKFKTNLVEIIIKTKLDKKRVTQNALIPMVLSMGSQKRKTQEIVNKKLEEMYGAEFGVSVQKEGSYQIFKFYLSVVNDEYLPKDEGVLSEGIEFILDIIFNPLIDKMGFDSKIVDIEKENLKQIISGKSDNKDSYAITRCIEEMYKGKPYSLYQYGYTEDIKTITPLNLYKQYKNLIENSRIDIYVSGNISNNEIRNIFRENEHIKKIKNRKFSNSSESKKLRKEIKKVNESMDISQGKLVLGVDVLDANGKPNTNKYAVSVYNSMFGGSVNSKLFQNVREKLGLAYTANSIYVRKQSNIIVKCGIDFSKYHEVVNVIKQQFISMSRSEFLDEEIEFAKNNIISSLKAIYENQDAYIGYLRNQDDQKRFEAIEDYITKIKFVDRDSIMEVANNVRINTIYFLEN